MTIISGYIIDVKLGLRNSAAVFSFGVVISQIFLAFAAYNNSYYGLIFGRFLAGFVSEPLGVARTKYVAKHAPSALTFGICLACSRFGSVASFNLLGLVYDRIQEVSVTIAITAIFGVTTIVCLCGFMVSLILYRLDKNVSRVQNRNSNTTSKDAGISIVDMSSKDYTKFRTEFWYIMIISILFYMSIFPFISIGPGWFHRVYSFTHEQARLMTSLPYIMSMILTPAIGAIVDRTRNHLAWIMMGSAFALLGHTTLVYLQDFSFGAWLGMSLIGVAYSTMAATLIPTIAFIVPVSLSATAFGLIFGSQSIAVAFTCPVVGQISDADWGGDDMVTKFFMCALIFALIGQVFLVRLCGFDPKTTIAYMPTDTKENQEGGTRDNNRGSSIRMSEFPVNFPRNFSELVPINEREKDNNDNIVRLRSSSSEKE